VTPTEERILNLVLEWDNTRYSVVLALIEVELKREAKNLAKERREAEVKNSEKG